MLTSKVFQKRKKEIFLNAKGEEKTRTHKEGLRGVLIAQVDPNDETKVLIGYSVCCKKDVFNFEFGKTLAMKRSEKMSTKKNVFWTMFSHEMIAKFNNAKRKYAAEKKIIYVEPNAVYIPSSIKHDMIEFCVRCFKYYKGKNLPEWSMNILKKHKPEILNIQKEAGDPSFLTKRIEHYTVADMICNPDDFNVNEEVIKKEK